MSSRNGAKSKERDLANFVLGIHIRRTGGSYHFCQGAAYIDALVQEYEPPVSRATPLPPGYRPSRPSEEDQAESAKDLPHRQLVGSLLYIAQGSRPDVAHAVAILAKYNSSWGATHFQGSGVSKRHQASGCANTFWRDIAANAVFGCILRDMQGHGTFHFGLPDGIPST